jgi:hypothetical protein
VWDAAFETLASLGPSADEEHAIDSTIVRAHQNAAGVNGGIKIRKRSAALRILASFLGVPESGSSEAAFANNEKAASFKGKLAFCFAATGTALRNPLRIIASQRLIFLHFDLKFYLGVLRLFWRDSNDKCSLDDEPRHG